MLFKQLKIRHDMNNIILWTNKQKYHFFYLKQHNIIRLSILLYYNNIILLYSMVYTEYGCDAVFCCKMYKIFVRCLYFIFNHII